MIPLDIKDEHTLWIARHLEGKTKVHKDVTHEVRQVPGTGGHPPVDIHLYWPPVTGNPRPRCAVFWMHGGGFVMESAASEHKIASTMAHELGVLVASIDYRLAPEHPYPAAIHDCYRGLHWLHENADVLGIDRQRIVIGGDSAGGGLAACLAQLAHDEGNIHVAAQVLLYPALDDRSVLKPVPEGVGDFLTRPITIEFCWVSSLGHAVAPEAPPYAAAARREDLSGLPPAWIGVGTRDFLCRESVEYAERLQAAGVDCELVVVPDMYHGMDLLEQPASTPVMVDFGQSKLAFLRRGLGLEPPSQ